MLFASTPGDRRLEFIRHPLRVLDVFAIEIDHVKAAIRSRGREDWMEPRIGRSEKLFTHPGALGDERGTVRQEPATLDEVVDRLANKEVAAILRTECFAPIDRRTARRREVIWHLQEQQR